MFEINIANEIKEEMLDKAKLACSNSYSPYSNFKIGCSILATSGKVYFGTNVENSVFQATCAESSAISQMITSGDRVIKVVLIYTPTAKPILPCGIARQLIKEFCNDCLILCYAD